MNYLGVTPAMTILFDVVELEDVLDSSSTYALRRKKEYLTDAKYLYETLNTLPVVKYGKDAKETANIKFGRIEAIKKKRGVKYDEEKYKAFLNAKERLAFKIPGLGKELKEDSPTYRVLSYLHSKRESLQTFITMFEDSLDYKGITQLWGVPIERVTRNYLNAQIKTIAKKNYINISLQEIQTVHLPELGKLLTAINLKEQSGSSGRDLVEVIRDIGMNTDAHEAYTKLQEISDKLFDNPKFVDKIPQLFELLKKFNNESTYFSRLEAVVGRYLSDSEVDRVEEDLKSIGVYGLNRYTHKMLLEALTKNNYYIKDVTRRVDITLRGAVEDIVKDMKDLVSILGG